MARSADNAVGMMDTAYFVGRQQLLSFFNDLLDLKLAKIEETATGAVACQLTEYIFPGSIPLSRINWEARSDYEFVSNYKLLQAAFAKNHVQRYVDVDKLIRAKYQDNLEFCQWLKAFYDQSGAYREDYNGRSVRSKGKGGKKYNDTMNKMTNKSGPSKPLGRGTRNQRSTAGDKAPLRASENKARSSHAFKTTKGTTNSIINDKTNVDAKLLKVNAELKSRIHELETGVCDIEKERDFYFGKLRSIELYLQIKQDKKWEGCEMEDVMDNLFKVLYATVDENIFVNDDGEIIPDLEENMGEGISRGLGSALANHVTVDTKQYSNDRNDDTLSIDGQ